MKSLYFFTVLIISNYCNCYSDDGPLYLTPLIEEGAIEKAQSMARVYLKGAENITSYSGFFTVDKKYNSNLFLWYFEAEESPETAPVLLWMNGGPGTSSLFGLLQEHGPFAIDANLQLKFREWHWTKNHHVVYLENPVGVGWSFTNDDKGYATSSEDCAINIAEAIKQFFQLFPNIKNNDFYVTGESYGGKYTVATAHQLINNGDIKNFKGIVIGNGLVDPAQQILGYADYLYQQGFLDNNQSEIFSEAENLCVNDYNRYLANNSDKTPDEILLECRNIVDPFSLATLFGNFTGYNFTYNILMSINPEREANKHREQFLELTDTRKAIHVGNLKRYNNATFIQWKLGMSILQSEKDHLEEALSHHLRTLIYNGQLDVAISYVQTVNYIKTLNFPEQNEYKTARRNKWYVDNEVAGYTKSAGSLTEVMVIGAGHMVPSDQPKRAFDLITKFTRSKLPFN